MKPNPEQQFKIQNDDISCGGRSETSDSSGMSGFDGLVRLFAGNCNSHQPPSTLPQGGDVTSTHEPNDQLNSPNPSRSVDEPIITNLQHRATNLERETSTLNQDQREEANIMRLVKTAKAQQQGLVNSLSSSQGVSLTKQSTKSPDPYQRSNSPDPEIVNDAHPVDVDSGEAWDESDVRANRIVSGWSGMTFTKRAFWEGSAATNSSFTDGDQPSIVTEATPRISNMSPKKRGIVAPTDIDLEATGSHSDDDGAYLINGRCTCTRTQILLVGLAAFVCLAVIAVVVAVEKSSMAASALPQGVVNQPIPGKSNIDSAAPNDVDSQSPSLSAARKTPFPSFAPTASPTMLSSNVPTVAPSLEWPQLFVPTPSSTQESSSNVSSLEPTASPIMPSSNGPTFAPSLEWPQLFVPVPSTTQESSSNSLEPSSTLRTMLPTQSTKSRKPNNGDWLQI